MQRTLYVATGVSTLLALSIACGRTTTPTTPVSPTGSSVVGLDELSDSSGATLKVTAPVPVSPINDVVLNGTSVDLVCTPSTGKYAGSPLAYDFELYNAADVKVRTEVVAGTTWSLQGLEFNTSYRYRVRATADNAYGPWSSIASFKTPDSRGYMRGGELFDPLTNGQTVGEMHGPLAFIPGVGLRFHHQTSYVSYTLPQTVTQGEFSLIVTGMETNTDGDKTKVFAMGQNYDDIVTNERRMTVEKRGDPAGVVAWRFITHDDQVDTEGPERQEVQFNPSRIYFFQASWRNNFFNLLIKENGVNGRVVYNKGKGFKGRAYDPNPHVIYLGAPVGRSGVSGASVDNMTIRNVWVSANPRPLLPGDTP